MIELWPTGLFPLERLIEQFRLNQINEAKRSSLAGRAVTPVLRA
jgi:Zn-dependent alcohol dehydrogenase